MRKTLFVTLLCAVLFACPAFAADAAKTLAAVDAAVNGPKDQDLAIKLVLIDKAGKESYRETVSLQKGTDKRFIKFLSPADQKDIALLSLPDDVMYLYMPAFKKTRRIASHVKNGKFAGTDFTYEDLEAKNYSDKWIPSVVGEDASSVTLELKPRPGAETDYSKLVMKVDRANNFPVKTDLYDKAGKLSKVNTRERIEKVGAYFASREMTMEDLKSGHRSKMILTGVKFDTGISADKFTERYLSMQ